MTTRRLSLVLLLASSLLLRAEPPAKRPAEAIQDNSFLVEEAYNQEEGVVQHILNIVPSFSGSDEHALSFVFTQEWPVFSQTHQLSYTVPYTFLDDGSTHVNGLGDILLNYRLQVLRETDRVPAFSPRFSVILPTGDADRGLGNDTVGYQVSLPLSKIVGDRWAVHANAGATFLPDSLGHDLLSFNLGASVIYAVSNRFNFMLETVTNWNEEANERGGTQRRAQVLISPGFRYAFNHPNDAQTVIGLAAPIGLTRSAPDYSVFLYASFEHFFWRAKK